MLVSATLTGNSEGIIADAIKSVVSFVDRVLVVDTGVEDGSLRIAQQIAGEKYVERTFAWTNDFSAARNFVLDAAHECGGDWAVMLDTDERISLEGEDLQKAFATPNVGCWMVLERSGSYAKERFFKLPLKTRYYGPTHEAFHAHEVGSGILKRARFDELPKTPEQCAAKFARDLEVLTAYTKEHPGAPRWFYYLGDALQNLERWEEAIAAYETCASLRGWNEEGAWACYRAADCHGRLGRFIEAVDCCGRGLALHSGIAELAWLAAFASYNAGLLDQAIYWAKTSVAMGMFRGYGPTVPRTSFRNPTAQWEGPFDILRWAYQRTGDEAGRREAERLFVEAKNARERGPKIDQKAKKQRR